MITLDHRANVVIPTVSWYFEVIKDVNCGMFGRSQMLTSFLEEAKVKRFSLCFNSGADGVLIAAIIGWREPTHSEELIDSDRPHQMKS